jgi:hypothetical protein
MAGVERLGASRPPVLQRLHGVIQLPLVPDTEDPHFCALRKETVERQVSRPAEGNHQLAQGRLHRPADQWMPGQDVYGLPDRRGGLRCGTRILIGKEPDRPLEIVERAA